MNPPFDGISGHGAPQNLRRWAQFGPDAVGQFVDVFQELSALGLEGCARHGGRVLRPLEARVSNIQNKKCHARLSLPPRQAVFAPAALRAAVGVGVWIAFKTLQYVVGL